jgi:hypothetical protein
MASLPNPDEVASEWGNCDTSSFKSQLGDPEAAARDVYLAKLELQLQKITGRNLQVLFDDRKVVNSIVKGLEQLNSVEAASAVDNVVWNVIRSPEQIDSDSIRLLSTTSKEDLTCLLDVVGCIENGDGSERGKLLIQNRGGPTSHPGDTSNVRTDQRSLCSKLGQLLWGCVAAAFCCRCCSN